jgi:alkanesulfonate monooxygenase SsuD/methylene tetrahydromethanopterin reductase-like flavin-dependent oxidoreductase (luciferase family)
MTERDPIVTAKAVSSLDRVSGGRFLFGVGAGWNREELAKHGDSVDELERRVATLRRRAADAGRVDDWVRLW